MKKIKILSFTLICLLTAQLHAQYGYSYTLVDNGGYSYTIEAVPDASASNFPTSIQSYGFTIIVPDGVTATLTNSLGGNATPTFFDGVNVAQPTLDGYLITKTLDAPYALAAPADGVNTPMVTLQVNGAPPAGTLYILANNSPLATAVTPLKSFMQGDIIDDGMAIYTNLIDANASGLSGTTSHDFSTLSIEEEENVLAFTMYPNPANEIINFKLPAGIEINNVEAIDMLGKQVTLHKREPNTYSVSGLPSGVYFIAITANNRKFTKRLIKN
ncbi:MAG: T9SS type A sorting domain-containing protein [Oceanihabitans sp.]